MPDDLNLGTIIGFAVAGYVFLTRFDVTRDSVARLGGGYEVLFLSAAVGFVGLSLSPLTYELATPLAKWSRLDGMTKAIFRLGTPAADSIPPPMAMVASAVMFAWAFAKLLNAVPGIQLYRKHALRRAARNRGDLIEVMLYDALRSRSWVELALDTGKSYVGAPIGVVPMTTEDADIEIVPVFSGHRTAPDRVLILARYYGDVIESLLDGGGRSLADLRVAIPVRQIVGARPFDLDIYRSFNPRGNLPSDRDDVQDA